MSRRRLGLRAGKLGAGLLAALLLSACASVDFDQSLARSNQQLGDLTQGQLALAQSPAQRAERRHQADALLAQALAQSDALRLALLNSPALQALLAQNWAEAASAAQGARMANPIFSFERMRQGDSLELGRMLGLGLLDLLTLPSRYGIAQHKLAQAQLRLSSQVLAELTDVRLAWVNAVAAQQSLVYAQQVNAAAQASAELARRLEAVGNWSRLQRVQQQIFYAEATVQAANAQQAARASREALVRRLGLDDAQAAQLVLPARLPEVPAAPLTAAVVQERARAGRLDLQLAQADYAAAAKAQGLGAITSLSDAELALRRNTGFDNGGGATTRTRGYEISLRLPIFDWGDAERASMNAQTLAAANRLEASQRQAGSLLRESYATYRNAFDVAQHYRAEVLPLQQTMAEENMLRYNGMFIGVIELLAQTQAQIHAVNAALGAQQQFWLSEAALQSELLGRPQTAGGL